MTRPYVNSGAKIQAQFFIIPGLLNTTTKEFRLLGPPLPNVRNYDAVLRQTDAIDLEAIPQDIQRSQVMDL